MIDGKTFLAVIPARGGSKSVPGKNIRLLAGKPLLEWTVAQINAVPEIDFAVVSTDDQKIADVARENDMAVIDRPPDLATDEARTETALLHALETLEENSSKQFDYIVVLEPTSPFRRPSTIRQCMQTIINTGAESLVTVVEDRSSIGRVKDGKFVPLDPKAPRRRQDREPHYAESSTVYDCLVEHLKKTGTLVCEDWPVEIVTESEALDINTEQDFLVADFLMRNQYEQQNG